MNDYSALLNELVSDTYEITAGKLPCYMIMGQSNAHPYIQAQMQEMLNAVGAFASVLNIYHGGKRIKYWYTTTAQTGYTEDTAFIDQINTNFEIRAIWWLQGGSDAAVGSVNFETYTENYFDALISYLGYTPDFNIVKSSYFGEDETTLSNIGTIRASQETVSEGYSGRKHDGIHYARADDWHLNEHNYRMLGYDLLTEYAKQKTDAF